MRLILTDKKSKVEELPEITIIDQNFSVALRHLESSDYLKRKIGFALCIPRFNSLAHKYQKIVKKYWINEPLKNKFDKTFCSLCDKTFDVK